MRVLLIEPEQKPKAIEIDPSLSSMQSVVGGPIQAVYPFPEPLALVCHEEGKLLGLRLNRALCHPDTGELYDIIAGTFFLCAAPPESDHFESLSEEQLLSYATQFQNPEQFIRLGNRLFRLPFDEKFYD